METIFLIFGTSHHFGFKSYYVVWKLSDDEEAFATEFCLNRTMQYGNMTKKKKSRNLKTSLNRTMQYGNYNRCKFLYAKDKV